MEIIGSAMHQSLTEMIEHVANEPSVGLFYVQQHIHKAVPILVSIKAQAVATTQEASVCTEDMKDAINSVKSMKEHGPPLIQQMIKSLNSSISLMSSMHQIRRQRQQFELQGQSNLLRKDNAVLTTLGSAFQTASRAAWRSHASDVHETGGHDTKVSSVNNQNYDEAIESSSGTDLETSKSFVQSVVKTALKRAGTLGWSSISKSENATESSNKVLTRNSSAGPVEDDEGSSKTAQYVRAMLDSAMLTAETVEQPHLNFMSTDIQSGKEIGEGRLPISGQSLLQAIDCRQMQIPDKSPTDMAPKLYVQALEMSENFEQFQAECVAKLETWLSESDGDSTSSIQEYDLRSMV